ncbi:RICIN domain-containing protein [Oerskovia enterophila]|uniref:Extracellular exo-alpha-L-arabinofuranosidase n=1 Tax=Oerskovia enterophila TaxID=43678 RepID=A0ABX2Y8F3_9CELL|nr:RICIN domain-containing protein [Oerskovia enterophila]OCI32878.1 extracellular exo-alpha-L-arabinofuranosidase precursor [Oerskovia enterophila]
MSTAGGFPITSKAAAPRRWTSRAVSFAAALSLVLTHLVVGASPAQAAPPAGPTSVVNVGSGKCVDARAASSGNGTAVQQYTCNGTGAQSWQVTATSDGYVRIGLSSAPGQVWDVANVSTADGGIVHLWAYGNGNNQQWQPVEQAGGTYRFVNRLSGKCLDLPAASTADGVQLQQYTCNGTTAQSFRFGAGTVTPPTGDQPDFGPNVVVMDPSMPQATVQNRVNEIFARQESNHFSSERYAILFKPGTYSTDVRVGFFTQVLGAGLSPDDVTINGHVRADARWFNGNATQNFWRGAEGLSVNPTGGTEQWAVSQAAAYRRMHVRGNLQLDDGGWSSGGLLADSRVDGQVRSGSQQQWLTRSSDLGSWSGSNWNMVFVGVNGAPSGNFPQPPYTRVDVAPVVREKPYLYVDGAGSWRVFVPAVRHDTRGASWSGAPSGSSVPIGDFYIAKPGDTAATINAALAQGKHLLVTPGVYRLSEPVRVTRANTVVLGLGLATLLPTNGTAAMTVADVDGVKIAGVLFDAGVTNSPVLLEVGPDGSSADHSVNPTSLHDVYFRVGGAAVGKAERSIVVNSDDVIGDHLWVWRGDHTYGIGWNSNTAANGLIVNGDDVTMYGLFVEHYQQHQTIWNGERGRTYFYQNELPYDPPNQAAWMNGSRRGWAAYKVADHVTTHEAWGLGSYAYFSSNPSVVADNAIEAPNRPGIRFHNMTTVSLGGIGTIQHIINGMGATAGPSSNVATLVSYP